MRTIQRDRKPLDVLLVEDSLGDVRLTIEAFRKVDQSVQLHVAPDGVAALAFLMREGEYADMPRPELILLDLNLPRMDGLELLTRIKADDSFKIIPTIILTTSEAEADIVMCYQLRANCYLTKPVQYDHFEALVKGISDFWLTQAKLPAEGLRE